MDEGAAGWSAQLQVRVRDPLLLGAREQPSDAPRLRELMQLVGMDERDGVPVEERIALGGEDDGEVVTAYAAAQETPAHQTRERVQGGRPHRLAKPCQTRKRPYGTKFDEDL